MSAAKISFPGFDTPAAGFEVPLEMLSACHRRVERQCQTMLRLVPHLAANGPDPAAREEAELLPLAARLLGNAQLDVVGRAMRLRRGIRES
jgi:hypothetical protein